jgi:hypothetical protein
MLDLSIDIRQVYANLEQGTDEWFRAKLGKVGASRVHDIVAKTKNKQPAASRKNYMADLLLERLTGERANNFRNRHTDRGNEMEPVAADAYGQARDIEPRKIGFVLHPFLDMAGASPDRMLDPDGIMQIKCPDKAQHLAMVRFGKIDIGYLDQMQWEMVCTERPWCDFVSFDDRFPAHLQLKIIRVEADKERQDFLNQEVGKFLAELDAMEKELRG